MRAIIRPHGRLIRHEREAFALFVPDHILFANPDRRPVLLGCLRVVGGKWPKRDHRIVGDVPPAWLVDINGGPA